MSTPTHVAATAVATADWLSSPGTTIVVPVYQRQYRWDIGRCEQLLADIRRIADAPAGRTHFLGSILSAAGFSDPAGGNDLVLIDGQQRITTIMLLVAALRHTLDGSSTDGTGPDATGTDATGSTAEDAALAARLDAILRPGPETARTRLRPHRAWADAFEAVVLGTGAPAAGRFEDNYAFFRSQIPAQETGRIWRGLQRLEHVAITLGADADAQQIFESLNSTGEPLRDHELIHNSLLMGLGPAAQQEIEEEYWIPIEEATGDAIGRFWRHALILATGREVSAGGEHGVYAAFRQRFPRMDPALLHAQASEWRELARIHRVLLDPACAEDPAIGRALTFVPELGRTVIPVLLRLLQEHGRGVRSRESLLDLLGRVESLLVRRALVSLPSDRIAARLCRALAEGDDALVRALGRIAPSDERVRVALAYSPLPHAATVLRRVLAAPEGVELEIEHIVPLAPGDGWTGGGARDWAGLTEDERNSHRALAATLGNLALLEPDLALRALDASYPAKRDTVYGRSAVPGTRALAGVPAWGTAAIAARTAELTAAVLTAWPRPAVVGIDDDGLTPILDAHRRRGWPRGWEREFEYVEYRGEHWEVHDVRALFHRVFRRGWADAREAVLTASARRGGPIYPARAWNGPWEELDAGHFLYGGWDAKYMMTAVQGVLEESGIAAEVFVKYSYVAAYM